MAQLTGKKTGILSQFKYTDGSGSAVQFKSLSGWDLSIDGKEIDWSDHDSAGWADDVPGLAKWKATVKGWYFEGDASQAGIYTALLEAITGGGTNSGSLACQFIPQVNTGNMAWTGNGRILSIKHSDGGPNGAQSWDITITGVGAIALTAQV